MSYNRDSLMLFMCNDFDQVMWFMKISWNYITWDFSISFQFSILTFSDKQTSIEEHQQFCTWKLNREKLCLLHLGSILTFNCFSLFYCKPVMGKKMFIAKEVMVNLSGKWTKDFPFNLHLHKIKEKYYSCCFFFLVCHFYFKMLINKVYAPT